MDALVGEGGSSSRWSGARVVWVIGCRYCVCGVCVGGNEGRPVSRSQEEVVG